MDILHAMSVLVSQPWLALVPGLILLGGGAAVGSRGAVICGCAWLVYCVYEYSMKLRILCSGECNIRIDLLALYPALILATLAGMILVARGLIRRRGA